MTQAGCFVIPDAAPDQKHFRGRLRGDPESAFLAL